MITFVYFDVGGVLIQDFSGTDKFDQLKTERGLKQEQFKEFDLFWDEYEPKVCVGLEADTLIPLIEKKFNLKASTDYSLLMDFVNRFEVNKSIDPVVDEVKSKYKVGLLTNMYPRMLDEIKKKGIFPDVDWDAVVDSSVDKVKKPDEAIYRLAEEKAGVKGEQILFIDNSVKNIEAAKKLGWTTFLYDSKSPDKSSSDLLTFFRNLQ